VKVQVKICGITSPGDALLAADAGADAVGLVFWPGSPRRVDAAAARAIGAALPPFVLRVGVFVDAPRAELARAADEAGLDVLQLHGAETPADCAALPRRCLKALRVGPGFRPQQAEAFGGAASGILLDTQAHEAPGGTGRRFDWQVAREVRARVPFLVLAGGLTPDNVGDAVRAVLPDAVDVSSGVESAPGRKDPDRVRAFVAAVRSACT
jgi:phosphoribosylanthranilate isomerase